MATEHVSIGRRLAAAWRVLCGGEASGDPAAALPPDLAVLRGRVASLEQDLRERDELIVRLKREYEASRRENKSGQEQAAADALEVLAGRHAPLLSQLDTMRYMHEQGKELRAGDLLKLLSKLQQAWRELGLEAVGQAGEKVDYDASVHQRLSGGDVSPGGKVRVSFVGYRFGSKMLTKAMVNAEGADNGDRA